MRRTPGQPQNGSDGGGTLATGSIYDGEGDKSCGGTGGTAGLATPRGSAGKVKPPTPPKAVALRGNSLSRGPSSRGNSLCRGPSSHRASYARLDHYVDHHDKSPYENVQLTRHKLQSWRHSLIKVMEFRHDKSQDFRESRGHNRLAVVIQEMSERLA